MALVLMNVGESRKVTGVRGKDEVIRHLQDMGFTEGAEVQVVSASPAGMILLVRGVRVALDRSLAAKVMVA